MTNEKQGRRRHDPAASMSGEPGRDFELQVKKNPRDKQAQVDLGSDESMDASDPLSACQPGDNDPAPSNDFPINKDVPTLPHQATRGHIVQTPKKKKPYKVILEHGAAPDTEHAVLTMREGEAMIKEETPTPPERDTSRDEPPL